MNKKYKIVALVGPAGAGKDYLLKELMERGAAAGLHEIVSYTSRPPRDYEKEGIDYYFASVEEILDMIKAGEFLEWAEFRKWVYGTPRKSLNKDKVNIGVFNADGIYQLAKNYDVDLRVIRIYANHKVRLMRQLDREESPDVKEIIRRWNTDEEDFAKLDVVIKYAETIDNNGELSCEDMLLRILDVCYGGFEDGSV